MEPDGDIPAERSVAWRQLDLCRLGRVEWGVSGCRNTGLRKETEGAQQGMEEMGENGSDIPVDDHSMDFLQGKHIRECLSGCRQDDGACRGFVYSTAFYLIILYYGNSDSDYFGHLARGT